MIRIDAPTNEAKIALDDCGRAIAELVPAAEAAAAGEGERLAEACEGRFACGVVLYDSADFVPFGEKLAAVPLSCLWA